MPVSPFPWSQLARVSRAGTGTARGVREALGAVPDLATVARALGDLLSSNVTLAVRAVTALPAQAPEGRAVVVATTDGRLVVGIEPEPALAAAVLALLLKRPFALTDPSALLGPRMQGALSALVVETARRAEPATLLVAAPPEGALAEPSLRVELTLTLEGLPHALTLWVVLRRAAVVSRAPTPLSSLGGFPITLSAVAAISTALRRDLSALRPGDVWLPGEWLSPGCSREGRSGRSSGENAGTSLMDRALERVALASADGERGVLAVRSGSGSFVVRGTVIALAADDADAAMRQGGRAMENRDDTLREIALDAPVVVRIEVASVTLPARDWAALVPGDVIGTGVRLAPAVVLRVGGREVARGDLVDIDGELGVSIRELVDPGLAP